MDKKTLSYLIGQRIVTLREYRGWNQSQLALKCNKDRQAIEKIENGKVNPTIFTLYQIACSLETTLTDLVSINNDFDEQ